MRVGLGFDAGVVLQPRYRKSLARLDVLLFPELMDGGYAAINRGKLPHSAGDGFMSALKRSSDEFSCTIIAGSTFLKEGKGSATNTSLVFAKGRLIHRYDKIHLFKPAGDTIHFRPGKPVAETFRLRTSAGAIRAGVVICFDLRFPELVRAMALQGVHALFVPARWPKERDDAWRSLLKARAIENQIFVVGCNSEDNEGGYSYAFDPSGRQVFSNRRGLRKPLFTFNLDVRELALAKQLHNNLKEAVFLRSFFR